MRRFASWIAIGAAVLLLGCKQGPWEPTKVTPKDVEGRIKAGDQLVYADVRSEASYQREHIKDAISFPYANLSKEKLPAPLPKDRWIVLYCT